MSLIDLSSDDSEIAAILDDRATKIAKLYVLLVNVAEQLIHLRKLERERLPITQESLDNLTERFDVISAAILDKKPRLEAIKKILDDADKTMIARVQKTRHPRRRKK